MPLADTPKDAKKGGKKQRDIVNLWRDPSAAGLAPNAQDTWQPTPAYWAGVPRPRDRPIALRWLLWMRRLNRTRRRGNLSTLPTGQRISEHVSPPSMGFGTRH